MAELEEMRQANLRGPPPSFILTVIFGVWGSMQVISKGLGRMAREVREGKRPSMEFDTFPELAKPMKQWMFYYLQKGGWVAIFVFASYPNAAFDLCGIAAGYFLVPFYKFFLATLAGKAVVKILGQACFFLVLFNERYLSWVLAKIATVAPGTSASLANSLAAQKAKFSGGVAAQAGPQQESWLGWAWGTFMLLFIGFFLMSIVNSFAQQHQLKLDKAARDKLKGQALKAQSGKDN
jgi:hypothetical protein